MYELLIVNRETAQSNHLDAVWHVEQLIENEKQIDTYHVISIEVVIISG
jgi:hypothetical protein